MAKLMLEYINSQPEVWKRVLAGRQRLGLGTEAPGRVVIVGSGSSMSAGEIAAEFAARLLGAEVTVVAPTRMESIAGMADKTAALWLAVSQSGRSTSTLHAVEQLRAQGIEAVAVTSDEASPVAKACTRHVAIDCGEERVGPKTKGMTATALTLCLMLLELYKTKISEETYRKTLSDFSACFDFAGENIRRSIEWAESKKALFAGLPHITVIADGICLPAAKEGALKLLETLYIPVFAYEFEEYLHGVNNTIGDNNFNMYVVCMNKNRERMLALRSYCEEHGCGGEIIAEQGVGDGLELITTGSELTLPFEMMIPFQAISALGSEEKGIDCDHPRYPDFYDRLSTKTR